MIQRWLDSLPLVSHTFALIERLSVPLSRARLLKCKQGESRGTEARQLLVDVSVICRHDPGTGIQRIVRAVLSRLLADPTGIYVVRTVAATRRQAYVYTDWAGARSQWDKELKVVIRPGDIFLGLDLCAHIIPSHFSQLARWKAQGATLHFLVYDLLPLHHPEWFSAKLSAAFRRWIKAVAVLADSAICISRSVEEDLSAWFENRYHFVPGTVPIRVIPMGWDIASTKPSYGVPPCFGELLSKIQQRRTALMVGTLEPRKGHAQVLGAFQQLWHARKDYNLVIVGRPGWKTKALQVNLRDHPERDQRLFWLDDASDEALLMLYRACDGVIIASLAEGFGLPLVEALGHGKPVLARDLPVFRYQAESGIDYFSVGDDQNLAAVIATWFERIGNHGASTKRQEALPSWQDAVGALVAGFDATGSASTAGESVEEPTSVETV